MSTNKMEQNNYSNNNNLLLILIIIITDYYTVHTCSLLTSTHGCRELVGRVSTLQPAPSWGQHKACLGISQTPECGALIWYADLWLLCCMIQ